MKEVVFDLEYTCAITGERVRREVNGFGLAKHLAKELAQASGRRAIIRRRPKRCWSLYTADVRTGRVQVVMESLRKDYAMTLLRRWNVARTECVLIAWPEWMPDFRMEIAREVA